MIDGLILRPLKIIPDSRGAIMHMLRSDAADFAGFGEVYFSCIEPGAIKAWRKHTRMTMQLCVPSGAVEIVLYDPREDSKTRGVIQTVMLSPQAPDTYALLVVPPGIWNGFRGLGQTPSIVANCASLPHDPDEAQSLPVDDPSIPYTWPET